MPSGPQPRNPCCCACNSKGLCLQCICMKKGNPCVSCLPNHLCTCSKYQGLNEGSLPQYYVPAASSRSSVAVQPVLSSISSGSSLATSSLTTTYLKFGVSDPLIFWIVLSLRHHLPRKVTLLMVLLCCPQEPQPYP